MKRSLFLLASLVLTSALYAQTEEATFTREQVLEIFAQYNPSVLQKAQENQAYKTLVDEFVKTFQGTDRLQNRIALIAATRNFENSIRLHALTEHYVEQGVWARMSGQDASGILTNYRQDVKEVMTRVFAVTLQLKEWELQEMKESLKQTHHADLADEQKQIRIADLKEAIARQKNEIKSLKKNAGVLVVSFTEQQVAQAKEQVMQHLVMLKQQQANAQENSSKQASDLQIKTNHKKPVAK